MPIRQNKVGIERPNLDEGHRVSCGRKRRGRKFRKASPEERDEASSYLTAVHCIYAFASWFGKGMVKANKVLTFSHCCKPNVDEERLEIDRNGKKILKKENHQKANLKNGKNQSKVGTSSGGKSRDKESDSKNTVIGSSVIHTNDERYENGRRGNTLPPLEIPGVGSKTASEKSKDIVETNPAKFRPPLSVSGVNFQTQSLPGVVGDLPNKILKASAGTINSNIFII
uniref:uncharacterized protein LOC120331148 n=1 Tax=Styela clava TaxID=7725 RepID=UPI0019396ADC|nr:uncharacterized protein LOC120331148 [Styela clava]